MPKNNKSKVIFVRVPQELHDRIRKQVPKRQMNQTIQGLLEFYFPKERDEINVIDNPNGDYEPLAPSDDPSDRGSVYPAGDQPCL